MVVVDAALNIRQVRGYWQSNHDKFSFDGRKSMVSSCQEVMKPGSRDHMFCSAAVCVLGQVVGKRSRRDGRWRYVTFELKTYLQRQGGSRMKCGFCSATLYSTGWDLPIYRSA